MEDQSYLGQVVCMLGETWCSIFASEISFIRILQTGSMNTNIQNAGEWRISAYESHSVNYMVCLVSLQHLGRCVVKVFVCKSFALLPTVRIRIEVVSE